VTGNYNVSRQRFECINSIETEARDMHPRARAQFEVLLNATIAPALRKSSGGIVSVGSKVRVDREKTNRSKELITSQLPNPKVWRG